MNKIIWLPLEPLPERYTQDWAIEFPREFYKAGVEFVEVAGERLTDKIETGRFLDVYGTIHWKSTQMANVAKLFRAGYFEDGDVFFDADLWHPGLESIRYMADLAGIDVTIAGVFHAGLWDKYDFLSQTRVTEWGEHFEYAWLKLVDLIFVGTQFHKRLIVEEHELAYAWDQEIMQKIKVTGLPFYPKKQPDQLNNVRNIDIVFPHRLDPEKCPDTWDEVVNKVTLKRNETQHLTTTLATMNYFGTGQQYDKQWYYDVLERSKVAFSAAKQETFGYSMLEAAAAGCTPVVPNRLSYKEIFPEKYRYNTPDQAVEMIKYYIDNPSPCPEVVAPYAEAIERMVVWTKTL